MSAGDGIAGFWHTRGGARHGARRVAQAATGPASAMNASSAGSCGARARTDGLTAPSGAGATVTRQEGQPAHRVEAAGGDVGEVRRSVHPVWVVREVPARPRARLPP